MKKNYVFLGICLVFFLFTSNLFGQSDIAAITLPINNLLEVRKNLVRTEGNTFPGGIDKYFENYKLKTGQVLTGNSADPFDGIGVYLCTPEMWFVQTLSRQVHSLEDDDWAEKEYADMSTYYSNFLSFQIYLESYSHQLLLKENLSFIYLDNTGSQKYGHIEQYKLGETDKKKYIASIFVSVPFPTSSENVNWFSLSIKNIQTNSTADMRWEFRKN